MAPVSALGPFTDPRGGYGAVQLVEGDCVETRFSGNAGQASCKGLWPVDDPQIAVECRRLQRAGGLGTRIWGEARIP